MDNRSTRCKLGKFVRIFSLFCLMSAVEIAILNSFGYFFGCYSSSTYIFFTFLLSFSFNGLVLLWLRQINIIKVRLLFQVVLIFFGVISLMYLSCKCATAHWRYECRVLGMKVFWCRPNWEGYTVACRSFPNLYRMLPWWLTFEDVGEWPGGIAPN